MDGYISGFQAWAKTRGLSDSTIRAYVAFLRGFLRSAERVGNLLYAPGLVETEAVAHVAEEETEPGVVKLALHLALLVFVAAEDDDLRDTLGSKKTADHRLAKGPCASCYEDRLPLLSGHERHCTTAIPL